eukprot:Skav201765  [mRNA]  locus=scaffold1973:459868:467663:- [translate_table: standard]
MAMFAARGGGLEPLQPRVDGQPGETSSATQQGAATGRAPWQHSQWFSIGRPGGEKPWDRLVLIPQNVESSYEALAESDCIPRRWHLEGRWGIPIERISSGEHRGMRFIPLLPGAEDRGPAIDAQTAAIEALPPLPASFTFAELFCGIGGFRLGLEALGGRCVFASEIERFTRELYVMNFGDVPKVLGDIVEVGDSQVPEVDLLVAGFPCQPFSSLGDQPAFDDERGLLFRQIVRILKASKAFGLQHAVATGGWKERSPGTPLLAKTFLLENVPGLLDCDDGRAVKVIQQELTAAGVKAPGDEFRLPFIPELHLRAVDFLQSEEELMEEGDEHFQGLRESKKWSRRGGMTDTLVWDDKLCNTLVSHYGTSLSKGNSQLVPRSAPLNPRRFSCRECARLMGFPDSYRLTERSREHPSMWRLGSQLTSVPFAVQNVRQRRVPAAGGAPRHGAAASVGAPRAERRAAPGAGCRGTAATAAAAGEAAPVLASGWRGLDDHENHEKISEKMVVLDEFYGDLMVGDLMVDIIIIWFTTGQTFRQLSEQLRIDRDSEELRIRHEEAELPGQFGGVSATKLWLRSEFGHC